MQALSIPCLLLLLAAPAAAQRSDWVSVDLGKHAAPGACPAVSAVQMPAQKQSRNVSTWADGSVSLSMRAWPDARLRDRQSIERFKTCARAAQKRVPPAQLVGAERAAEEVLKAAIAQCLADQQSGFSVRSVVLSRSSVSCG